MKAGFGTIFSVFIFGIVAQARILAADSTGLPGDNFSLEGALEMFKEASSPEAFEKMLNSEENKVNNLDLNGDGETDYIRVVDKSESDAHAFILQALVSPTESQDIAVIELEKNGNNEATVQIVGDEDIYGEQKILEPTESVPVNAGTAHATVAVNVVAWPMVRYVYVPTYRVWVSPWRWHAYPGWYRPWRPVHYHVFYGYRPTYYRSYSVVHTHRVVQAHRVYVPVRTTSVTVRTRNEATVAHYRATRPAPGPTVTHSTTTVTGANGRSATKTTATVKGKHGKRARTSSKARHH